MLEFIERLPVWFWLAIIAHLAILGSVAYLILLERKVASWVQDRIGPNRVGKRGLLQPLADGLKFILKEEFRTRDADRILFTLAPALMIAVVILSIAVLPWGGTLRQTKVVELADVTSVTSVDQAAIDAQIREKLPFGVKIVDTPQLMQDAGAIQASVTYDQTFQIAQLNIGLLFILAVLSLAVYGVVIGGWASNNKYSFLGGLRATANMISYEIPLGLAVLAIVVMFGTLDLGAIVNDQAGYWAGFIPAWNVFVHPVTFLIFLICLHAEANRAPFDLAEAEQELVGGYHTEYSSMRFALFFLGEYAGMVTTSAMCVALFFGGWHLPWIEWAIPGMANSSEPGVIYSVWIGVLQAVVFFGKTLLIIFVFMWVRWTLPRFRFDQLLNLAWRALIPMMLILLLATAVVMYVFAPSDARFMEGRGIGGLTALMLLVANIVVALGAMVISTMIPAQPDVNRRMVVHGSRFTHAQLAQTSAAS